MFKHADTCPYFPKPASGSKPPAPCPVTHDLKTWPRFYRALIEGRKTFEVRKNDRGFKEGDELLLREWDPDTKAYTGRGGLWRVDYLTELPCAPGFVGMSVSPACPSRGE